MPLDATANFVRGETDSSTDSTQTTVSVVDASIFPDPATEGEFNVVIWDVAEYPRPDQDPNVEILRVTAIDTTNDDLTVTRGQEGTSGASHPLGSAVHLSPTAKMFGDIETTFNEFYDDGAQELTADVNNSLVNTDEAQVTADPTSNDAQNPRNFYSVSDDGNTRQSISHTRFTGVAGDVTDKLLIDKAHGHLVVVRGKDEDADNEFTDLVLHQGGTTGETIAIGKTERESPPTRSYTQTDFWGLAVSLGGSSSNTYEVTTFAVGGRA